MAKASLAATIAKHEADKKPKPMIIIAQVAGSGTAEMVAAMLSNSKGREGGIKNATLC